MRPGCLNDSESDSADFPNQIRELFFASGFLWFYCRSAGTTESLRIGMYGSNQQTEPALMPQSAVPFFLRLKQARRVRNPTEWHPS